MTQTQLTTRPRSSFSGRLVAPRSFVIDSPPDLFVADPGRFHLYAGWFSQWAHRSTLVLALAGLEDVVSVSYIDASYIQSDPRSRPRRHDPVNGFAQLRDAYEASDPDYDGPISVPTLWDRETHRVVTNDRTTLEIDLATELREWSTTGVELYPQDLRDDIDELDRWLGPAVNEGIHRTAGNSDDARAARDDLHDAFAKLERRLANSRYLLGDRLTLADVRLWVTLVRFEKGTIADGRIGRHLPEYSCLWAYTQDLYQREAFRATTDPAIRARAAG
jgi:putative glutathione S-transferase